jgi:hypothetical protein
MGPKRAADYRSRPPDDETNARNGLALRELLDQIAARSANPDMGDLLPDVWAIRHAQIN